MLGRVMMPIGTASCTACNTRFIISPSPSGLPFGLPFGREHFVVYTDYHRKKSVCSVYSVFILYQMVVSIAWLSKLE